MPKIVDSEQYRKELLHQCFDLFADKGYANVTTRQLSKALGISTGAMYHYFPSKQALFEQLVEEICFQDVQLFQTAVHGHTPSDRIEELGNLLIEHEEHFIKQATIWVDFYQNHALAEINESLIFQQVDQQYQQAMVDLLGIPDLKLARFIWTLINGILIEQTEDEDYLSFEDKIHLLVQMLTAYFEKHVAA
ncbi:MAG: TetR/AcrR family transcriptional regulator [Cyanobacteria bacterium P01_H01_bin.105]